MKKVILLGSLVLVLGFIFQRSIVATASNSGATYPCYSTFKNVKFGGYSTVDCTTCGRVNHVTDRQDKGTCTSDDQF